MKRKLFHEPIISFFIVYLYYIQLGRLDFYYWMDGKDSFSFLSNTLVQVYFVLCLVTLTCLVNINTTTYMAFCTEESLENIWKFHYIRKNVDFLINSFNERKIINFISKTNVRILWPRNLRMTFDGILYPCLINCFYFQIKKIEHSKTNESQQNTFSNALLELTRGITD